MTDAPLKNTLPQTIAIVRALPGLGDLLCVVPALRAIRSTYPEAALTLIGLPSAKEFVQRFSHYLDRCLEFPGFPGISEMPFLPARTTAFLLQAQQLKFDLVLQMHGSGSHINGFALLLGAKDTAGFFPAAHVCPNADRFLPYPEQEPEIWRHLRLLEFLGMPLQGDQLEFPLERADWQAAEALAAAYGLNQGRYICIHPGASAAEKCWLSQHFSAVADAIAAQGYQIVLTGTASEASLTQAVAQRMRFPVVDLAGQTHLGGMAALLKKAQLLICNDTGVSHLAAALRVNSVVIFTNSDPHRWAPLDRQLHRAVGGNSLLAESYPTPAIVLQEAQALLQREAIYVS
ncbi:glycosyltransferase family 9 protein [Phormidium tenue FACHB-886]|nr:glycosyltransferase family 9 protein [Phormidium tenue FACHB-886]